MRANLIQACRIMQISRNHATIRKISGCTSVKPNAFFRKIYLFEKSTKASEKLDGEPKREAVKLLEEDAQMLNSVYLKNKTNTDSYLLRKTGALKTAIWTAVGGIAAAVGTALFCSLPGETATKVADFALHTPGVGAVINFLSETDIALTDAIGPVLFAPNSFYSGYVLSIAIACLILASISVPVALGRHAYVQIKKKNEQRRLGQMEAWTKAPGLSMPNALKSSA